MKFIQSFLYAINGIRKGIFAERNIRIIFLSAVLAVGLAIYLNFSSVKLALIILLCVLIIAMEMVNLALEKYIDYVSPEQAPEVAFTKDVLAGAVLILSLGALGIAYLFYYHPLLDLLLKLTS